MLDKILRSMEEFMSHDKRTFSNPVSDDAWIFDKVYEWYKTLKELEYGMKSEMESLQMYLAKFTDKTEIHLNRDDVVNIINKYIGEVNE